MNCPAPEALENSGFLSGSSLALLHLVLHDTNANVPRELLTDRLALRACVQSLRLQGRAETEDEVRDAYLLAGDDGEMGPAGDMLALWKTGMALSLKQPNWRESLVSCLPEVIQENAAEQLCIRGRLTGEGPVEAATAALLSLLEVQPREEAAALLVTEILLAGELGWAKPIPLMAHHLKRPALRSLLKDGDQDGFRIACHVAIAKGAQDAVRLAHDLARRRVRLEAVASKLRAKGSDDAVALFLSEDAVFPSTMLAPFIKGSRTRMSDHAARRLCSRLIDLGAIRELTGRTTFRMYGV